MAGLTHLLCAITLTIALMPVCAMSKGIKLCRINKVLKQFDDTFDFCCEDGLQRKDSGGKCCHGANRVYYPDDTICCGTNTFNRYEDGVEFGCCNGHKIKMDQYICCDDTKHHLPQVGSGDVECCGRDLINRSVDICCRSHQRPGLVNRHAKYTNINCCGHKVIDSNVNQCFWDNTGSPVVVGIHEAWCAGQVIKLRDQSCCSDVIYDKPRLDPQNMKDYNPHVGCCGTTGYDPTQSKCCLGSDPAGSVIPNKTDLQCCRGNSQGYYNRSSELCCEGRNIPKTSSRDQCCGSQSIDGRRQGCCNHQPFDLDTEFCCEGIPSSVMSKGEEFSCCGGQRLGKDSLCCGNTPVQKTNSSDDKCCQDFYDFTYKTYTDRHMSCYNGRVERRKEAGDAVCNDRRYLPRTAVCCNDTIHVFPDRDTLGCCVKDDLSETPFSQNHQICCHGNVYNMSENDSECCEGRVYKKMSDDNPCTERCGATFHDKTDTICCGRRVHEKKTEGDACCGNKAYFSNTSRCCGADQYDHKTHRCCGDSAVIPRRSKTQRCCRNFMAYNKKYGRCLSNKLVQSKKAITPLKNICRKKTWNDISEIQLDVCFKKIAVRCKILGKTTKKDSQVFTMTCRNLKRQLTGFHESFAVQDESERLELSVTSTKQTRCSGRRLVGKKVLMFLQQQATRVSDTLYSLTVGDGDRFRVVEDKRHTRQMISKTVTEKRCKQIRRKLSSDQRMAFLG